VLLEATRCDDQDHGDDEHERDAPGWHEKAVAEVYEASSQPPDAIAPSLIGGDMT
jgi:hypothetical protein